MDNNQTPYKHHAKKRFGQNFLHDQNVIKKIINAINPITGEHIVEIGPGQSALTKPLLNYDIKLDVIEIDRELVQLLKTTFPSQSNLTIHENDALNIDYSTFSDKPIKVIGNLPYNISTALLFHLIKFKQYIHNMTFMLQKEVVDRICASPGNKQYGRLSVILQYYCEVDSIFTVKAGAFNPAPKVDSAIIKLSPITNIKHTVNDEILFEKIIADAFNQRRKTLRNTLKSHLSDNEIMSLGIQPSIRAENLSVSQFVDLTNFVAQKNIINSVN